MVYYIYLAIAVIVIIAVGVAGVMLIRRSRRAAMEMRTEALEAGVAGDDPPEPAPVPPPSPGRSDPGCGRGDDAH